MLRVMLRGLRRALSAAAALALVVIALVPGAMAAGPPFPDPVDNQAVYDTAEVLTAETEATVEAAIDKVEAETGAEVVVYTQLVPDGITAAKAEADAIALMDQWGVGRAGVNDGLVILFDLKESDPCHGQVQLYAGKGYRETWLSNEDKQRVFENDMLPKLRECDLDGALLAAMDKVSGVPTWRVVNSVVGLVLAPLVLVLLVGRALFAWYREGRDPVYLDDPSILVPAPPPGLTPAAGAAIRDGGVARRSLTAASLDLAVRGYAGFRAEPGGTSGGSPDIGIFAGEAISGDPAEQARMVRARRRPMDPATVYLRGQLAALAGAAAYIEPDRITELGQHVSEFNKRLETHLVAEGWYRERPSLSSGRWMGRGILSFVAGMPLLFVGLFLPSSGVVLLALALIVSAIALVPIASAMPACTRSGAVIRAMLEAYRRTLEKTMAQARSMGQVVAESAIPLIETPDDAVAWGVALGLQDEVEQVLARSSEDAQAGATGYYMPTWYLAGGGADGADGGGGGWAPGLMSSSPIPNLGGMMTALGTIGNSPVSSSSGSSGGSGGGGGFSGGSSGGGGGGSGGGF